MTCENHYTNSFILIEVDVRVEGGSGQHPRRIQLHGPGARHVVSLLNAGGRGYVVTVSSTCRPPLRFVRSADPQSWSQEVSLSPRMTLDEAERFAYTLGADSAGYSEEGAQAHAVQTVVRSVAYFRDRSQEQVRFPYDITRRPVSVRCEVEE